MDVVSLGQLMNIVSDLIRDHTHLELSYKSIKYAYYITDLTTEANVIVLRWYAKIPFFGHLISFIRFKLCDSSAISEKIQQVSNAYKGWC